MNLFNRFTTRKAARRHSVAENLDALRKQKARADRYEANPNDGYATPINGGQGLTPPPGGMA